MLKQKNTSVACEKFKILYFKELEKYSEALIVDIKTILAIKPNPDVNDASIELFTDELGEGWLAIKMTFNGKHKEVDEVKQGIYCGLIVTVIDITGLPVTDFCTFEEIFISDIIANIVNNWFLDCWKKANGHNYSLKVEAFNYGDFGDGGIINLNMN